MTIREKEWSEKKKGDDEQNTTKKWNKGRERERKEDAVASRFQWEREKRLYPQRETRAGTKDRKRR